MIKKNYYQNEQLPIGDIKVVIDDGSDFSANYIGMLEKSGYQLYVENDIDTSDLSLENRFKTIYQKKILYEKIKPFISQQQTQ